jgi:hypothetical protein
MRIAFMGSVANLGQCHPLRNLRPFTREWPVPAQSDSLTPTVLSDDSSSTQASDAVPWEALSDWNGVVPPSKADHFEYASSAPSSP